MTVGAITVAPLRSDTGLCQYDDPELWFKTRNTPAAAICANCPIIAACGQRALDLGVTDGIWAGVALPGARQGAPLAAARAQLAATVERYRRQPPAHRKQNRVLREAIHYAAVRGNARDRIGKALTYATPQQVVALKILRTAVEQHKHTITASSPAMLIREAVDYAAQEYVSA